MWPLKFYHWDLQYSKEHNQYNGHPRERVMLLPQYFPLSITHKNISLLFFVK